MRWNQFNGMGGGYVFGCLAILLGILLLLFVIVPLIARIKSAFASLF
jgi:hypothetical protein